MDQSGQKGGLLLMGTEGSNHVDRAGKLCFLFLDLNDAGIIIA